MTRLEDGFYWVALPGRDELTIAQWRSFTEQWSLDGWDWHGSDDVGVISGPLYPPEQRSGCVHARVYRRGSRCLACGTHNLPDEGPAKASEDG